MSQFDRAGSVTGINCTLGSYENFQPGFRGEKKVKDPGDEFWRQIRETEQNNIAKHKNFNFCAYL